MCDSPSSSSSSVSVCFDTTPPSFPLVSPLLPSSVSLVSSPPNVSPSGPPQLSQPRLSLPSPVNHLSPKRDADGLHLEITFRATETSTSPTRCSPCGIHLPPPSIDAQNSAVAPWPRALFGERDTLDAIASPALNTIATSPCAVGGCPLSPSMPSLVAPGRGSSSSWTSAWSLAAPVSV